MTRTDACTMCREGNWSFKWPAKLRSRPAEGKRVGSVEARSCSPRTQLAKDISPGRLATKLVWRSSFISGTASQFDKRAMTSGFIQVPFGEVFLIEEGDGATTVVLNSGGRAPSTTMRPLADKLSHRHRVIIWDRANQGLS